MTSLCPECLKISQGPPYKHRPSCPRYTDGEQRKESCHQINKPTRPGYDHYEPERRKDNRKTRPPNQS